MPLPFTDSQDSNIVTLLIKTPDENKKGQEPTSQTKISVIARTDDFPKREIIDRNNIIHYVLSMSTSSIINEVNAEFGDEYIKKQQSLHNLLYRHGKKLNDLRHKAVDRKEPLTTEERNLMDRANKAEAEISDIFIEFHNTIKDRVSKQRQKLINNLSLDDMDDIVTAVRIYIGNFYFGKMIEVWDLLMYDIEKVVGNERNGQLSKEEQISFIENSMKEIKKLHCDGRKVKAELLYGKKCDYTQPEVGASGGIASFLSFIKKNDINAHSNLIDYIKWSIKTSTSQLRYTPQKNLQIYYSALQERQGESKSVRVPNTDTRTIPSKSIQETVVPDLSLLLKKTAKWEDGTYSNILQAKATNTFQHTSKRNFILNPISQIASVQHEGVEIFLKNYNNIVLNVPTHKVLDILTIKLTKKLPHGKEITAEKLLNHRNLEITVKEYMDICGLKDRKEATKQVNEAIKTLFDVALKWVEVRYYIPEGKKRRVKETFTWNTRILESTGTNADFAPVKHGKAIVEFTVRIAEYLSQAYIMPLPIGLLKINGKLNPHSYFIGRKQAEHHNMNIGKENSNRISVLALIQACPDLPSYEEVMEDASGSVTQKIIQPFERDLIALKEKYGLLKNWRYCNSNGEPLTNEQIESYSYSAWIEWMVEFELANYPDQSDRLAKIAGRKKIYKKR